MVSRIICDVINGQILIAIHRLAGQARIRGVLIRDDILVAPGIRSWIDELNNIDFVVVNAEVTQVKFAVYNG